MINGFEYRDNSPKCPERSDSWLSPSSYECDCDDESEYNCDDESDNECEEDGEDDENDECSDDD